MFVTRLRYVAARVVVALKKVFVVCVSALICSVIFPAISQGTEYYVAVASTPAPRNHIEGGKRVGSAVGWSTKGSYAAGREAERACNAMNIGRCASVSEGQSNRGGCVSLVLGYWQNADRSTTGAYFAGTSAWKSGAEQDAINSCEAHIHSGKTPGEVLQWRCDPKNLFCSSDVQE